MHRRTAAEQSQEGGLDHAFTFPAPPQRVAEHPVRPTRRGVPQTVAPPTSGWDERSAGPFGVASERARAGRAARGPGAVHRGRPPRAVARGPALRASDTRGEIRV